MTVSSEAASITAQGDGSNKDFAYNFLIPYQADGVTAAVTVYTVISGVKTLRTITTDYTITGVSNPAGGNVHYPVSGSALAVGSYIIILRDLDYVQEDAFTDQGFRASSVETMGDTLEMQLQQTQARLATFLLAPCLVSALPAVAPSVGVTGFVTDATVTTQGTTVAGGGSNFVRVYSNGTNWVVG